MLKKFLPFLLLAFAVLQVNAQSLIFRPETEPRAFADSILVSLNLKNTSRWKFASTPHHQPDIFPEGASAETYSSRINNARLCWNSIDPLFYENSPACPPNILNDPQNRSGFFVCQFLAEDLFPGQKTDTCCPVNLSVFNLSYYPSEKGPYNFDCSPGKWSAGIDSSGQLKEPQTRWGGIMRTIEGFDTEQGGDSSLVHKATLKYLDFWLMDPFVYDPGSRGGTLYFDLGHVSEDVLPNGLQDQESADMGYDNAGDVAERETFSWYLDSVATCFGPASGAFIAAEKDPAGDNYRCFRGHDFDQLNLGILDRYRLYNGTQGNSTNAPDEPYSTIASTLPDSEDLNRNGRPDTVEAYFQFRIHMTPETLETGGGNIIESRDMIKTFPNGVKDTARWYHFRIPLNAPDTIVGPFSLAGHLQFIRIFARGFGSETHFRFATLDLQYMAERPLRGGLTVYPNPTDGLLTIDFDSRTPRSVMLFDNTGKLVLEQAIDPGQGRRAFFDLSNLSNAIYLLKILTDQETVVKKVVIAK